MIWKRDELFLAYTWVEFYHSFNIVHILTVCQYLKVYLDGAGLLTISEESMLECGILGRDCLCAPEKGFRSCSSSFALGGRDLHWEGGKV